MFAALAVKDHEEESEESEGSSKKAYVIIALVVLAAIFTAYTVYLKTHDSTASVVAHPAPQQTAPAPQAQGPATSSPAPAPINESAAQEIVLATPKVQEPAAKKPFSDVTVTRFPDTKSSAPSISSEVTAETAAPETVVVKHNAPAKAPKISEPDVAAPPIVTTPSDDKAIASIAAVSPASVAKPVASTVKVSQGVSQGLLIKRVQPIYPSQAMQMRLEGTVLLQANITKEGKISNLKVLKGEGILAKAAMDAVKQWTYNPYLLNGEPVEIQTQMSITFKLP